ncbi:RNB-domain-containing protein [Aulographum hederae CBS 113979]|uniref:RNB-domain-containing protein n=1 Tax=Aulographum hederae CBS 113979 TaxID=1176131 RepID=A0A6G1HBP8_9PEZI|nr:RNB-domain-containing protein [Aulographum hederae CBS 113979]
MVLNLRAFNASTSSTGCWRCFLHHRSRSDSQRILPQRTTPPRALNLHPRACYHTQNKLRQELTRHQPTHTPVEHASNPVGEIPLKFTIRDQLTLWQQNHGGHISEIVPDLYPQRNHLGDDFLLDTEEREDASTTLRPDDEGTADLVVLQPGDLVEFLHLPTRSTGVVVQADHSTLVIVYTKQGKWTAVPKWNLLYVIPRFIESSMIEAIRPWIPESTKSFLKVKSQAATGVDISVPRTLSAPIIQMMNDFSNKAEAIYRQNTETLDNAHDILSHPTDLRFGTLHTIADRLLGKPQNDEPHSQASLFAVRKAITNCPFGFNLDNKSHSITLVYEIRSKSQLQLVESVRAWTREYQEYLADSVRVSSKRATQKPLVRVAEGAMNLKRFVEKAQRLVSKSRAIRPVDKAPMIGSVHNPSSTEPVWKFGEIFTDTDKAIIKFLEAWSLSSTFDLHPTIHAVASSIVRYTGVYDGKNVTSRQELGVLFLQEIGVVPPFLNPTVFDEHLLLPTAQHSKPLENLAALLANPEDGRLEIKDSMADLRRDWKDLAVYCIDDADAEEIDDGISVEQVPGSSDIWVRIHVANPAAFFDRQHPLARMAGHMTGTVYMPDGVFPMLPTWLTQGHFSLAPNRPVLTFSAKIDSEGNILETEVQPGIIHNVHFLTPKEADHMGGHQAYPRNEQTFILGDASIRDSQTARQILEGGTGGARGAYRAKFNVSAKMRADMEALYGAATARHGYRHRNGAIADTSSLNATDFKVRVCENKDIVSPFPYRDRARWATFDPIVQVTFRMMESRMSSDMDAPGAAVKEMMILAGEIAAKWCAARGIPIIYRAVQNVHGKALDDYMESHLQPYLKKNKNPPAHLLPSYWVLQGTSLYSTTPGAHRPLGVPCYTQVTSPLRRFADMINHWQIQAALRHEARTGRNLANALSPSPPSFSSSSNARLPQSLSLPFQRPELTAIMTRLKPREALIQRAKRQSADYWLNHFFVRVYSHGETGISPPMPPTFTAVVFKSDPGRPIRAYSPDFGIMLQWAGDPAEYVPGDVWEVQVTMENFKRTDATPLKLLEKFVPLHEEVGEMGEEGA